MDFKDASYIFQSQRTQIKNCPFCGGKPDFGWNPFEYIIYCSACHSKTPKCPDINESIKIWNQRV